MSKPIKVVVKKEFNAPPEKIFDAWLDPDWLDRWMFGPNVRDEKIIKLENDPREGGQFSYVVDRDGQRINHMGTYWEIQRPNRLVFTWGVDVEAGDESVVMITILPAESGCRLTLIHTMDPKWEEYKDRTRDGWNYMLDKLKKTQAMNSEEKKHRIYTMSFARVYPHYVAKAEKKGRTKAEVDEIIRWLTGYSQKDLETQLEKKTDFETFLANAPQLNPSRYLIKGVICGVRVEDIKEPTMQEIRYLDKLIDELARGKKVDKILRE